MGPITVPSSLQLQVSRFGVSQDGANRTRRVWRLILDLSGPDGRSVIDGLDRVTCSLLYVTVDGIAAAVTSREVRHY